MVESLFAYGTLQIPELLHAVLGEKRAPRPGEALLHDFVRLRVRRAAYPAITFRAGATTRGRIYDDIDADFWAKIDRFETKLYERVTLEIEHNYDPCVIAQTYIITDKYLQRLTDEPWDLDTFREKHLSRYLKAL